MAREEFIDSLRFASRMLSPPRVSYGRTSATGTLVSGLLDSADLWLTPKAVEGFDPDDFADWPVQDREKLAEHVAAFVEFAQSVPADKPVTKSQAKQAHRHLDAILKIVRQRMLPEWIKAQENMLKEAAEAAEAQGWYVERDEKEVSESLLGTYKAPRLRIKSLDREVVLNPIACFGSGRQGIVDLVVLPTYETAYYVLFKNGRWNIASSQGTFHRRPFNRKTLINTINRLPRC
jgi:hypothetical protein